jgi:hypothetical protein
MNTHTPEQLFEAHLELALRIGRSFPLLGHAISVEQEPNHYSFFQFPSL